MFDLFRAVLELCASCVIHDLSGTSSWFSRLTVIAQSGHNLDTKEAIGMYEFTINPRSFFSADGSVLMCRDKAQLIHCLTEGQEPLEIPVPNGHDRIAIVDGMVLVQALTKNKNTKTVQDRGDIFIDKFAEITEGYKEIHLVFDTHIDQSLKEAT